MAAEGMNYRTIRETGKFVQLRSWQVGVCKRLFGGKGLANAVTLALLDKMECDFESAGTLTTIDDLPWFFVSPRWWASTGMSEDQRNRAVQALRQEGLIRVHYVAENRGGVVSRRAYYGLDHDRLAAEIAVWLADDNTEPGESPVQATEPGIPPSVNRGFRGHRTGDSAVSEPGESPVVVEDLDRRDAIEDQGIEKRVSRPRDNAGDSASLFARDGRRTRPETNVPYLVTAKHRCFGDHYRSPSGLHYPALPWSGCTENGEPRRADQAVRANWVAWSGEHGLRWPARFGRAMYFAEKQGDWWVSRLTEALEQQERTGKADVVWFRGDVDPLVAELWPAFTSCRIGLRDLALLLAPWAPIEHADAAWIATAGMLDAAATEKVSRWIGAQRVANLTAAACMDGPVTWAKSLPAPGEPDWVFEVERAQIAADAEVRRGREYVGIDMDAIRRAVGLGERTAA